MRIHWARGQPPLDILRPDQLDSKLCDDLGDQLLRHADVGHAEQAAGAGPGVLELSPFWAGKRHRDRGGDRRRVERTGVAVQAAGAVHRQDGQLGPRQPRRLLVLPVVVPLLLVFILVKHTSGHAFSIEEVRPFFGVEVGVEQIVIVEFTTRGPGRRWRAQTERFHEGKAGHAEIAETDFGLDSSGGR